MVALCLNAGHVRSCGLVLVIVRLACMLPESVCGSVVLSHDNHVMSCALRALQHGMARHVWEKQRGVERGMAASVSVGGGLKLC